MPGVFAFSSATTSTVDYESEIKEAKALFEQVFPGEAFLPRAPDAEDIVIEDEESRPDSE